METMIPKPTTATEPDLPPVQTEPVFVIRYKVNDGHYLPVVELDTTDGAVTLDAAKHTITCQPESVPYSFILCFRAPFLFAQDPVLWIDPRFKPAWVAEAELVADNSGIDVLVVDASYEQDVAKFSLNLQHPRMKVPFKIDPTIVSNPPNTLP